MITKKYNSPPLIEALCEFVFKGKNIDPEILDSQFRGSIDSGYSERVEKINVTLDINPSKEITTENVHRKKGLIQYKNPESGSIVQIGENLLAINQLNPYQGWELFFPTVTQYLEEFKKVTGLDTISQSKVRYINQINIPENDSNIGDYFKYSLMLPPELSSDLANIRIKTENIFNSGRDIVTVELYSTKPSQENFVSFVLDISFTLLNAKLASDVSMNIWLSDAHKNINNIFEAVLTDKCKKLFD